MGPVNVLNTILPLTKFEFLNLFTSGSIILIYLQLSLPPSEMASDVLSDLPESADRYEFNVQDGDVIIMATDGIFDNVPDSILVAEIR